MTIDPPVRRTIPFFEEAKPPWDVLKKRFDIGNGPRKQQIKTALAECRQLKMMAVAEYFGMLQPLWDELATYNPLPTCKYGKCTFGLGEQFQARVDEDRFHDFLYGINDELYSNMRSNLLAQDPLPSLDRAYQAFLQEERLRSSSRSKAECDDVITLVVKPQFQGSSRSDTRNKSEFCVFLL